MPKLVSECTPANAEFHPWHSRYAIPADTDILINATSVGLFPNTSQRLDIDFERIQPTMVVADGIHNPPRTHLLQTALSKGCRIVDGLQMLVNQGVIGIKYWTGVDADPGVMHAALKKVLNIADGTG